MKIKTVNLGLPPVACNELEISTNYTLGAETAQVYWQVKSEEGLQMMQGNLEIPNEIVAVWGTDDSVIEKFVLETLKLTK